MSEEKIELNDLVLLTMPDGSTLQGVVQSIHREKAGVVGLGIFHPIHGNIHWGVFEGDRKSQGATVKVIPDSEADFAALHLYKVSIF